MLEFLSGIFNAIIHTGHALHAIEVLALAFLAVVFFRSRTEVSITINDLKKGGGPTRTLRIRNFAETSLLSLVGQHHTWARKLWQIAQRNVLTQETVLFLPEDVRDGILGGVRGQVATTFGRGYVTQALSGVTKERTLVITVCAGPHRNSKGWIARFLTGKNRVSIQCVPLNDLVNGLPADGSDCEFERDSIAYRKRMQLVRRIDQLRNVDEVQIHDGEESRPAMVELPVAV